MKMKLYITVFLFMVFTMSGCFKDEGSSSSGRKEVITVTGIADRYQAIVGVTELKITPEAVSTDGSEFDYKWILYEGVSALDTIATSKDLSYVFYEEAKNWTLAFVATNLKTGYSEFTKTIIELSTEYTRGWYVVKDDGENSDLDLFVTTTSMQPASTPAENLMNKLHKRTLSGKAIKLTMSATYTPGVASWPPNKKQRTLFVMSENQIFATIISSMKIFFDASNISYLPLSPCHPQGVVAAGNDHFMMNNGRMHTIAGMMPSSGIFSGARLFDADMTDYKLSKFMAVGFGKCALFDNATSSFVGCNSSGQYIQKYEEDERSELNANNNGYECIYLSSQDAQNAKRVISVLQNKITKERIICESENALIKIVGRIKPTTKANTATLFTLSQDYYMLYFASEGRIWSYNMSNGSEKEEFTLPTGEEAVVLRHLKCDAKAEPEQYHYNYIIVGSNKAGIYKFRMFETNAGSFATTTPNVEFSGNGNCGDIMYISPNIANAALPYY